MTGQKKVRDNTALGYFPKDAIISAGNVTLQDSTLENYISSTN